MITVTAKQLRENLSSYLDRMEAGEEVAVIRHSRIVGLLTPHHNPKQYNGRAVAKAMREVMIKMQDHKSKYDLSKGYKHIYSEMLTEKYGTYR